MATQFSEKPDSDLKGGAPHQEVPNQTETPDKQAGPVAVSPNFSTAAPPPPNAGPTMRGVDMFSTGPGAGERAQMMRTLQRQVGNTRVANLIGTKVQTKISVGAPNDEFEQEADHVADKVTGTNGNVQRNAAGGHAHDDGVAPAGMEDRIKSPGGGQPLPEGLQREMEGALGADFSGVRVHTGQTDAADAARLGAKAFTHGNNIFLGTGESPNDRRLMAHELTHVVQQGGGGEAVRQKPINDSGTVSQNDPFAPQVVTPEGDAGQKPQTAAGGQSAIGLPKTDHPTPVAGPAAPGAPLPTTPTTTAVATPAVGPPDSKQMPGVPPTDVTSPAVGAHPPGVATPGPTSKPETTPVPPPKPETAPGPTPTPSDLGPTATPSAAPGPTPMPGAAPRPTSTTTENVASDVAPTPAPDSSAGSVPPAAVPEISPTPALSAADQGPVPELTDLPEVPAVDQGDGSAGTGATDGEAPQAQAAVPEAGPSTAPMPAAPQLAQTIGSPAGSFVQRQEDDDGGGLLENIKRRINGVVDGLRAGWTSLSQMATEALTTIRESVNGMIDGLTNIVMAAFRVLQSMWASITARVTQLVMGLRRQVESALDTVLGVVGAIGQAILRFDGNALRAAWNRLLSVFAGANQRVQQALQSVQSTIAGLWQGLRSRFDAVLTTLTSGATSLMTRVQSMVQGLRQRLSAAWDGLRNRANQLSGVLGGVLDRLRSLVGSLLSWAEGIWNGIRQQWGALTTRIAGWMQQLGALVTAAWQSLRQRAMSLWTSLQGLWARLQQWVGRQVQRVIGNFMTLWTNIRSFRISQLIDTILHYAPFLQAVAELVKDPNIVLRPLAQGITAKISSEMPAAAEQEARKRTGATGSSQATTSADEGAVQRTVAVQRQVLNEPLDQNVLWGDFWDLLVAVWDDFWTDPLDNILKMLWDIIAFWETVPRDFNGLLEDLGKAWNRMWAEGMGFWRHLLDIILIIVRRVTAILLDLYPLFLILSVAVGAIAGGIGGAVGGAILTFMAGGVGAAPGTGVGIAGGAGVGLGFALGVGEGLLAIYIAGELLSLIKAWADLSAVKQTEEEQIEDLLQMVTSSIGLGIAIVLLLLSAIAGELAKGIKLRLKPGGAVARFLAGVQRGFRGGSPFRRGRGVSPTVPDPAVVKPKLSIAERLAEFFRRLQAAPKARSADEAFNQIRNIMNEVEDEFSGVVRKDPPPPIDQPDGRMYPPQEDFTKRNPDGSITARTRGHRIRLGPDGSITITNVKTGATDFQKPGGG